MTAVFGDVKCRMCNLIHIATQFAIASYRLSHSLHQFKSESSDKITTTLKHLFKRFQNYVSDDKHVVPKSRYQ